MKLTVFVIVCRHPVSVLLAEKKYEIKDWTRFLPLDFQHVLQLRHRVTGIHHQVKYPILPKCIAAILFSGDTVHVALTIDFIYYIVPVTGRNGIFIDASNFINTWVARERMLSKEVRGGTKSNASKTIRPVQFSTFICIDGVRSGTISHQHCLESIGLCMLKDKMSYSYKYIAIQSCTKASYLPKYNWNFHKGKHWSNVLLKSNELESGLHPLWQYQ